MGGTNPRVDEACRPAQAGRLVERRPDPGDRRGTLVRLTPLGKRLIDRAVDVHVANDKSLLSTVDDPEAQALDSLLRKLLAGLER